GAGAPLCRSLRGQTGALPSDRRPLRAGGSGRARLSLEPEVGSWLRSAAGRTIGPRADGGGGRRSDPARGGGAAARGGGAGRGAGSRIGATARRDGRR